MKQEMPLSGKFSDSQLKYLIKWEQQKQFYNVIKNEKIISRKIKQRLSLLP